MVRSLSFRETPLIAVLLSNIIAMMGSITNEKVRLVEYHKMVDHMLYELQYITKPEQYKVRKIRSISTILFLVSDPSTVRCCET